MSWPETIVNVNKFHYLRGGSERYAFDLEEILAARGHRVVPFSMEHRANRPTPYARHFVSEARWSGASALAKLSLGLRILHSREAASKISALLREEAADLAHLHNFAHQISPSILGPLRARGIPVVQTLHDYKLICPNYRLFTNGAPCERCRGGRYWNAARHRCGEGGRLGSVAIAVEATAHRLAGSYQRGIDLFLAPSRFLMEKAVAFGVPPERVRHLPYPIPLGPDAPRGATTEPRGEAPYFLYAGRLAKEKGIETLLAAAARVPSAPIRIAGDGELRARVDEAASRLPNVRALGHLDAAALGPLQRGALALVVPSEWYENLPFAVLEAFAAGTPVIASRTGGIPEMVADGETGFLFPPGDSAALAACLERALAEPGRLREMGRRGREVAALRHDPGRHYEALLGAYGEARRLSRSGRAWAWRRAS